MSKVDPAKHCPGCRDDYYNHGGRGMGGGQCWNLTSATLVKARDVPTDMPPPYLALPLTTRPSCYSASRVIRVKPEALDSRGFWKS